MLQTSRPWHEPEGEGLYREKVIYLLHHNLRPQKAPTVISCHCHEFIFRKQEFLEAEPECGVSRHRQFSKRIIGGEKAKFSELPWQAHIRSVTGGLEAGYKPLRGHTVTFDFISGSAATSVEACS